MCECQVDPRLLLKQEVDYIAGPSGSIKPNKYKSLVLEGEICCGLLPSKRENYLNLMLLQFCFLFLMSEVFVSLPSVVLGAAPPQIRGEQICQLVWIV